MTRTKNRSNAAQASENMNAAMQQVNNSVKGQAPANDTPVPANVEDIEARLSEGITALDEIKKQAKKLSDKLSLKREFVAKQSYVVAVAHMNAGTASADELALIARRKSEDDANAAIAKAIAAMPKDTEDVAKARELAKSEEGSLSSAIAETKRQWNSCYRTLYGTIGITKPSDITPNLLKDLCPYLMVASADGLKAASVTRSAVRKNGKAVKKNNQRVYKYTLRERNRWSAYGLFETLERNFRWSAFYGEDELKVRRDLLNAEVAALAAVKAAKEAEKSEVAEEAHDGSQAMDAAKAAAKAAQKVTKGNTAANTKHTTKGGRVAKAA